MVQPNQIEGATYLKTFSLAGRGLPSSSRRPGPNDCPCAHFALLFLSRLNSLASLRRSPVKVWEADMMMLRMVPMAGV